MRLGRRGGALEQFTGSGSNHTPTRRQAAVQQPTDSGSNHTAAGVWACNRAWARRHSLLHAI